MLNRNYESCVCNLFHMSSVSCVLLRQVIKHDSNTKNTVVISEFNSIKVRKLFLRFEFNNFNRVIPIWRPSEEGWRRSFFYPILNQEIERVKNENLFKINGLSHWYHLLSKLSANHRLVRRLWLLTLQELHELSSDSHLTRFVEAFLLFCFFESLK